MLNYKCPSCGKEQALHDRAQGRLFRCPGCNVKIKNHPDGRFEVVGGPPDPVDAYLNSETPSGTQGGSPGPTSHRPPDTLPSLALPPNPPSPPPAPLPQQAIIPTQSLASPIARIPAYNTDSHVALDKLSGRLVGNYLLIGLIGSGATSHVYLAEHQALKRRMPVKILSLFLICTPDKARKLLSESVALAKVDHPNVARVYDCNTADGITYLALEYVDGHSLDQLIKLSGILSPDRLQTLARHLLEGLNAIHSAGLLHLDIKPGNILATNDHTYKYADFGLSKGIPLFEQPVTNKFLGTPEYAAPELAVGRSPDVRSDLYALGATLYKAATGRVPFSGDNVTDILKKQLYEPLIPPSVYNPAIPPHLDQFITKLMSKERDQRPSSCIEAIQLLSLPLRRSPVTRRSMRGKRVIILSSKSSPIAIWLMAGVCAAALVGVVFLALNRNISRNAQPNRESIPAISSTVPDSVKSPMTDTHDVLLKEYRAPSPIASVLLLRQGTYLPGLISQEGDHFNVLSGEKNITVDTNDTVSWFKTSHEMSAEAKLAAADAQFLYERSRITSELGNENSLLNQALGKSKAALDGYSLTRKYFSSDADRWLDERITKMCEMILLVRQRERSTRASNPPSPRPWNEITPADPRNIPATSEEPRTPKDPISEIKGYLLAPDIRLDSGPRGMTRDNVLNITRNDSSPYDYAFAIFLSRSEYDWGLRWDELTLNGTNIHYQNTPGRVIRKSAINAEFELSQGGVISISQSPNVVRFTPPGGESQAADSFSIGENVKTRQLDELQYYFNAVIQATDRHAKARHMALIQQIQRSITRLKKDEPALYPAALHAFLVMHLNTLQSGAFGKSDKGSLEAIYTSVGYVKSEYLEIWGTRVGIELAQYHDNVTKGGGHRPDLRKDYQGQCSLLRIDSFIFKDPECPEYWSI